MDRGEIVIKADKWPGLLYDEDMYDEDREWVGLFRGETFVHVSSHCVPSVYVAYQASLGMHMHTSQPLGGTGVAIRHSIF